MHVLNGELNFEQTEGGLKVIISISKVATVWFNKAITLTSRTLILFVISKDQIHKNRDKRIP